MKIPAVSFKNLIFVFALLLPAFGSFAQMGITTEQYREDLLFLQKTVHEAYPFLFKKTTAADFDKEVTALYEAIPDLEDHEVLVGLTRLVASFEYGHTVLGYWENVIPIHQLPIVLYHFDDGVYLQGVHKDYAGALGTRLLAIEDMPIEEVLKRMRPVVPAENDQFVKAYGIHYLTFPEFLHAQGVLKEMNTTVKVTIEKDGKQIKQEIRAVPMKRFPRQYGMVVPDGDWLESRDQSATPLYLKNLDKIYYYEYLPEQKAVYVRQSQIQDDSLQSIPEFYKEVFDFIDRNEVDKMILDVRLNGGGNNYKNKPVVTGVIANKKINQPGKFFVILGRRTFSACQNLVNELHNYTNAIFVGEPTAENINFYGDNQPVILPNTQLKAYLSFAWWQDKPQWENKPALYPQIATGLTFEQYRTNQDPALEAVLSFKGDTFITDPMGYFTELFTSGQAEKILPEAQRMLKDPVYAFFDFEREFNQAGYNLLGQESFQEAIYVFQLNTTLFPESANAWDSLAEANWKSGNLEKAREFYSKAISLDPAGPVGENARAMLEEMVKPTKKD
ncbi:Tetratricopeptide repeat-containing protein [Muriicola jejuensis]|uniref:Tetratricopeptide repeat protein n=1 Tax=Muriicola jejuensis TaxID=504488 RepID=A0A6P0UDJ0_9FLAO|nr:tetratricopeptide repeat protein [Muriicola jejuensis]NER11324.1 tetratricopeptide repeat protein [Muriicola jejuensis]SMP21452.1 Tetratricopeptide repeat-containing protein [Muriicola jejuensis]